MSKTASNILFFGSALAFIVLLFIKVNMNPLATLPFEEELDSVTNCYFTSDKQFVILETGNINVAAFNLESEETEFSFDSCTLESIWNNSLAYLKQHSNKPYTCDIVLGLKKRSLEHHCRANDPLILLNDEHQMVNIIDNSPNRSISKCLTDYFLWVEDKGSNYTYQWLVHSGINDSLLIHYKDRRSLNDSREEYEVSYEANDSIFAIVDSRDGFKYVRINLMTGMAVLDYRNGSSNSKTERQVLEYPPKKFIELKAHDFTPSDQLKATKSNLKIGRYLQYYVSEGQKEILMQRKNGDGFIVCSADAIKPYKYKLWGKRAILAVLLIVFIITVVTSPEFKSELKTPQEAKESDTMSPAEQEKFAKDLENYLADNKDLLGGLASTKTMRSNDASEGKGLDVSADGDFIEILGNNFTHGDLMDWIMNKADRNDAQHQKALQKIALNYEDGGVKEYAVNKVTDLGILSDVVLNNRDRLTRMAAVDSLKIMNESGQLKELYEKIIIRDTDDERVKNWIKEALD